MSIIETIKAKKEILQFACAGLKKLWQDIQEYEKVVGRTAEEKLYRTISLEDTSYNGHIFFMDVIQSMAEVKRNGDRKTRHSDMVRKFVKFLDKYPWMTPQNPVFFSLYRREYVLVIRRVAVRRPGWTRVEIDLTHISETPDGWTSEITEELTLYKDRMLVRQIGGGYIGDIDLNHAGGKDPLTTDLAKEMVNRYPSVAHLFLGKE